VYRRWWIAVFTPILGRIFRRNGRIIGADGGGGGTMATVDDSSTGIGSIFDIESETEMKYWNQYREIVRIHQCY